MTNARPLPWRPLGWLAGVAGLIATTAGFQDVQGRAPAVPAARAAAPLIDAEYLTAPLWNDGDAEIVFYDVRRSQDQRGQPVDQTFRVGTFLVKHEFDRKTQSKARRGAANTVSAFKWAMFYELESTNGYQYKRSYVLNAAQADLHPLKQSFASFDWCSNQYRELAFLPDGQVRHLRRSDDYGNSEGAFPYPVGAYPVALVPLLVRALDFSGAAPQRFAVLLEDGGTVPATARRTGTTRVDTPDGARDAEAIEVSYDGEAPSLVGERADAKETYWRGLDADRTLLEVAADSGRYRMSFVEQVRVPYWQENVYDVLQRVTERP